MAAFLFFLVVAYVIDWTTWRSRGDTVGTITVSHFVVAPLKGNKVEYYPDGAIEQSCSHSLFGHADHEPCWWVDRHRITYE